jgi:hypothetical protein
MEQSSSWEDNSSLRKQKFHYRIHNIPPLAPPEPHKSSPHSQNISQSPTLILSCHLSLDLPSGLFPSGFPTNTMYAPPLFPKHATFAAHLFLFYFITRIILVGSTDHVGSQYAISPTPVTSSHIASSASCSQTPPSYAVSAVRPSSTPKQNNRQNDTRAVLIFTFLDSKLEDRRLWPNDGKHSTCS